MKQNSTKTFAELLWDHDDIRMCIPKSLRYEDVYPSFDFKPLIMPGLTPGLQAQLSNLEYELKQFYLLTAILKKFSISNSVVTAIDIRFAEVGVETVYYHHSEVFHDIESFLGNVMYEKCLHEANLEKVKQYCEDNFHAITEMLKISVKLVERYGNIFSSVPKYYYYEEEES